MAYTTYLGDDGRFKIHRTGCTATAGCYVEGIQHVYPETYDTVREAINGILSEEVVRIGSGIDHVDDAPCCHATNADFQDREIGRGYEIDAKTGEPT